MSWIQLHFDTTPERVEAIEDYLLELGALAVTLSDLEDVPVYEPEQGTTPLWPNTRITALFAADCDILAIKAQLLADPELLAGIQWQQEIIEDQDWIRAWMDQFEPMSFGNRLWIVPSWHQPPKPEACNLILDPGLAFGSGTHPTTSLCLQWLDEQQIEGKLVVDYGCGSGILGMAALLLGAQHLYGIDNDPQAIIASHENAKRNGIASDSYELWLPDQVQQVQADLMLANILASPLISLKDNILALLKPGGKIALSGILAEQATQVMQSYASEVDFDAPAQQDNWIRLTGIKKQ